MGAALTFTITVSSALQRASVAVTIYWVVTVGLATGLDIVALFNPPDGVQEYWVALEFTCNWTELPSQIVTSVWGVTERLLVRPTVVVNEPMQPRLSFTVIV